MSTILLISGSPSSSSKSQAVLEHLKEKLQAENILVRKVGIRDFPAEDLVLGKYDSPAFEVFKKLVEEASALVISSPIYKASFTGGLKSLLDILPQSAFKGKTILSIATGGSSAHYLAIDFAFKPVFSALGASDLLQGVYLVDNQWSIDADGKPVFSEEIQERLQNAVEQLAVRVKEKSESNLVA